MGQQDLIVFLNSIPAIADFSNLAIEFSSCNQKRIYFPL